MKKLIKIAIISNMFSFFLLQIVYPLKFSNFVKYILLFYFNSITPGRRRRRRRKEEEEEEEEKKKKITY